MTGRRALHVSAHPDDEAVGCPASLVGLAEAGWQIANVLATVGRPEQEDRRLKEATGAAAELGMTLHVAPQLVRHAAGRQFEQLLLDYLTGLYDQAPFDLLISPTPHDMHPRHEAVGRACAGVAQARPVAWWSYAIWGELAVPTLYLPYNEATMRRVMMLLSHYDGELARNDYRTLVRGRASASTVLGSERVFGFGRGTATTAPFAELLTEVRWSEGAWRGGHPRILRPQDDLGPFNGPDLSQWLLRPSDSTALTTTGG
jgi:LmbE family N-acetylglucosaminyl deacetylase